MKERQAARLAAVIALPVALVAGLLAYRTLSGMRAAPQASVPPPDTTAPVSMPVPSLADADTPICRGFIANLPGQPRGLQRRTVTAGIEQNAAYGNPPITISCGGTPPAVPADADIYPISGVCWYADDSRPDATVWWTLDRRVPIAVTFPASYRNQGEGDWLQEFRDTIVAWVPSLKQPPAYCTPPSTAPS